MKFDVSDISFFKIKMLQFHTFPATYRKRLQREGAINHFYGNIIFCYLNRTPWIAVAPEIVAWTVCYLHAFINTRILELAQSYDSRPACHGASVMVSAFRFTERITFCTIMTASDGIDTSKSIFFHAFIKHSNGSTIFKSCHDFGKVWEWNFQTSFRPRSHK